jgi:tetratricopeptide (TPR) repeat protein
MVQRKEMMADTERMKKLQNMLEREPEDTFLLYGMAMELKKADEPQRAIEYFERVIQLDPGYCYAYHQRGLVYESMGDLEAARRSYLEGIAAAERTGDGHAKEEITAALTMLE